MCDVDPVAGLISTEPPEIDPSDAALAIAPALWLLDRGQDGIALTQTGALSRALVREAAKRWPAWWNTELHGSPNRETDLALLHELHWLLRDQRLLRRRSRRLETTARGRKLLGDPPSLLETLATELLAGESFRAACAELAVPLLLTGFITDYSKQLAERIQPAIAAQGWQHDGESPGVRDVSSVIADFLRPAQAVGLLKREHDWLSFREPLRPTESGRAALIAALRARALAPWEGPY